MASTELYEIETVWMMFFLQVILFSRSCFWQWPCINESKVGKKKYVNSGVVSLVSCEVSFILTKFFSDRIYDSSRSVIHGTNSNKKADKFLPRSTLLIMKTWSNFLYLWSTFLLDFNLPIGLYVEHHCAKYLLVRTLRLIASWYAMRIRCAKIDRLQLTTAVNSFIEAYSIRFY